MRHPSKLAVCSYGWVVAIAGGTAILAIHGSTPGEGAAPATFRVPLTPAVSYRMSLVMFVHPRCPCSAASLIELSRLMSDCGPHVNATVVFFQPSNETPDWSRTPTWAQAERINGVKVLTDWDASLAKAAGAKTSGQVIVYDASGGVAFWGGITGSRGHVGENDGFNTVRTLLLAESPSSSANAAQSPAFGCPINLDERQQRTAK